MAVKFQEYDVGSDTNRVSVRTTKKKSIASSVTVTQNSGSKLEDSDKNQFDYKGIVKRKITNASFASSNNIDQRCRQYEENATFVSRFGATNAVQNICYFQKINFNSIGKNDYTPPTSASWRKRGTSSSSLNTDRHDRLGQNSYNGNTNKIGFRHNRNVVPPPLINNNVSLTNASQAHDVPRQPPVTSNATAPQIDTSNLRVDSFVSNSCRTNNRLNVRCSNINVNEKKNGYIADRTTMIASTSRNKRPNVILFF